MTQFQLPSSYTLFCFSHRLVRLLSFLLEDPKLFLHLSLDKHKKIEHVHLPVLPWETNN